MATGTYTTYNSDGSIRSQQTAAQKKSSDAAAIANGTDTPVGVGGKLQMTPAQMAAMGTPQNAPSTGTPPPPPAPMTNKTTTPSTAPNDAVINPPTAATTPTTNPATGQTAPAGFDPLTGNTNTAQITTPESKYKQALSGLQATGPAPQDRGAALGATTGALANYSQPEESPVVSTALMSDPVTQLMSSIKDLLNPQVQTTTLLEDYKSLYKESGLDQINKEIIDAETVINGTEQDIRNEIQTAGGFGTESQVQALALSRNKSLLTRYNQLVQMKTDATNQLNTMSQLNSQDKQMAQTKLNTQISAMFNLADFAQKAQNNTREQAQWLTQTIGVDGIYNAYKNDPRQLSFLEKTLGVAPGGLAQAATTAAAERARKTALETAQLHAAQTTAASKLQFVAATANQPAGTFNPITGVFTPLNTATPSNELGMATSKSNIDTLTSLTSLPGLGAAVGPNSASRASTGFWDTVKKTFGGVVAGAGAGALAGAPFAGVGAIPGAIGGGILGGIAGALSNETAGFTGQKQAFVAGVEQMTQQLTLDKLIQAKQSGATFGALSDGERGLLSASASKIGTWAIKDDKGNVLGYNANEADFKKELDSINNFAKLDYVLKGGDPASVGIQVMADGTLWTPNSNGTYTKLR